MNHSFEFGQTMMQSSDEELVRVVYTNRSEYVEDAVAAAEAELRRRRLPEERIDAFRVRLNRKNRIRSRKAMLPLALHWKILAFLLPGVFLYFSPDYSAEGYDRKGADAIRFTIYGFGFYLLVAFVANQL